MLVLPSAQYRYRWLLKCRFSCSARSVKIKWYVCMPSSRAVTWAKPRPLSCPPTPHLRPSTRAGCWTRAGTSWPSWRTCRPSSRPSTTCVSCCLGCRLATTPSPPPPRWASAEPPTAAAELLTLCASVTGRWKHSFNCFARGKVRKHRFWHGLKLKTTNDFFFFF